MPADPSDAKTTRLRALFQGMQDPFEIISVNLKGCSPREIIKLLPEFDPLALNPAYGILVDNNTWRAYTFWSGMEPDSTTYGELQFRKGLLREVPTANSNAYFVELEPHIEAQAAAFMRKNGIADATLYINAANPCLGFPGCNANLPDMLPPGSRLRVFGTQMEGTYCGMPD